MNEHIIAKNVIIKHNFSILSILWEKLPLANNTNIANITPRTTIGASIVECKNVANPPTTIIPMATIAVK